MQAVRSILFSVRSAKHVANACNGSPDTQNRQAILPYQFLNLVLPLDYYLVMGTLPNNVMVKEIISMETPPPLKFREPGEPGPAKVKVGRACPQATELHSCDLMQEFFAHDYFAG